MQENSSLSPDDTRQLVGVTEPDGVIKEFKPLVIPDKADSAEPTKGFEYDFNPEEVNNGLAAIAAEVTKLQQEGSPTPTGLDLTTLDGKPVLESANAEELKYNLVGFYTRGPEAVRGGIKMFATYTDKPANVLDPTNRDILKTVTVYGLTYHPTAEKEDGIVKDLGGTDVVAPNQTYYEEIAKVNLGSGEVTLNTGMVTQKNVGKINGVRPEMQKIYPLRAY